MADIFNSSWLVAGFAFGLGLAIGWIIWGGAWRDLIVPGADVEDAAAEKAGKALFSEEAGLDGNLKTLLAELEAASARLAEQDDAEAVMDRELDQLDQAVKRANGRLKLIEKSLDVSNGAG